MTSRRYSELDWLRVILILAVFLHHVFMPFNGDGWHIMNRESSKLLDDIMVYFEQIRLPILFFIAGAGSYLLLAKTSVTAFLKNKFYRLFLPLMIGMMFVVPPQNYFENIHQYETFLSSYTELMFSFEANHLWFIEFLIVFMVLAIPFVFAMTTSPGQWLLNWLSRLGETKHGLFALVLILMMIRLSLKLIFPSQDGKLENLSVSVFYLFLFLAGACFISRETIWASLAKHRVTNLKWFVASSIVFYAYYFKPDISAYVSLDVRWQIWWAVCTLVTWSGLLTLVGFASATFKETPNWLRGVNELIYPFYILHQSVIVILAFYIVKWQSSIAIKAISLLVLSLGLCWLICFYLIRPVNTLRFLFGLKTKTAS